MKRLWTVSVGPRATGTILYHGYSFARAVRAGVEADWPTDTRWYMNGRLLSDDVSEQLTLLASECEALHPQRSHAEVTS